METPSQWLLTLDTHLLPASGYCSSTGPASSQGQGSLPPPPGDPEPAAVPFVHLAGQGGHYSPERTPLQLPSRARPCGCPWSPAAFLIHPTSSPGAAQPVRGRGCRGERRPLGPGPHGGLHGLVLIYVIHRPWSPEQHSSLFTLDRGDWACGHLWLGIQWVSGCQGAGRGKVLPAPGSVIEPPAPPPPHPHPSRMPPSPLEPLSGPSFTLPGAP